MLNKLSNATPENSMIMRAMAFYGVIKADGARYPTNTHALQSDEISHEERGRLYAAVVFVPPEDVDSFMRCIYDAMCYEFNEEFQKDIKSAIEGISRDFNNPNIKGKRKNIRTNFMKQRPPFEDFCFGWMLMIGKQLVSSASEEAQWEELVTFLSPTEPTPVVKMLSDFLMKNLTGNSQEDDEFTYPYSTRVIGLEFFVFGNDAPWAGKPQRSDGKHLEFRSFVVREHMHRAEIILERIRDSYERMCDHSGDWDFHPSIKEEDRENFLTRDIKDYEDLVAAFIGHLFMKMEMLMYAVFAARVEGFDMGHTLEGALAELKNAQSLLQATAKEIKAVERKYTKLEKENTANLVWKGKHQELTKEFKALQAQKLAPFKEDVEMVAKMTLTQNELARANKKLEENGELFDLYDQQAKEQEAQIEMLTNLLFDTEVDDVDMEENDAAVFGRLEKYLKGRRILLVGGVPQWVRQMSDILSKWTNVSAPSPSTAGSLVSDNDIIIFSIRRQRHGDFHNVANKCRAAGKRLILVSTASPTLSLKRIYEALGLDKE
jgi:hypothetical protein